MVMCTATGIAMQREPVCAAARAVAVALASPAALLLQRACKHCACAGPAVIPIPVRCVQRFMTGAGVVLCNAADEVLWCADDARLLQARPRELASMHISSGRSVAWHQLCSCKR